MTDFLPLFPLKLVVYPGESLNLHIFEPRYKQLIRECEENNITFGIPGFINSEVMNFGTEMELLSVEKRYDSGEIDIKTRGLDIFKIKEYYRVTPNKLYAGADIERLENSNEKDLELNEAILNNLSELYSVLNVKKPIPKNGHSFSTYEIAHHVGFSLEQEYEFLCLPSEIQRQTFILDHMTNLIPVVREMERLRKRAQLNGHFKNVIPPEL